MPFAHYFLKTLFVQGSLIGIALLIFCAFYPQAYADAPALAIFLGLVHLPLALWMSILQASPIQRDDADTSTADLN